MHADPDSLIYLYGIVPADAPAPPPDLTGLEERPVRLHSVGQIAAVVSGVPQSLYGDDPLNARLDDLAWVGDRGVAHERVLDWFVERCPIIPLSLFSIHRGLERVQERLRSEEPSFGRLLARLAGHKEWGIKLWRREAEVAAGIDRLSPSLGPINREIDESPPGRRFLLERKRETIRAEEVRAASKRVAHEVFDALSGTADGATSVALPGGIPGAERTLLLHAAFLVADERFDSFREVVNAQAARLAGSGFEIEFTGPWPPYHFTSSGDE